MVGAGVAACAPRAPEVVDPSCLIEWTKNGEWIDASRKLDKTESVWPVDGLVGGGCPCTLRAGVLHGRELDGDELRLLEKSKYYINLADGVNVDDETYESGPDFNGIWTGQDGYIKKAHLIAVRKLNTATGEMTLSDYVLSVEEVNGQTGGGYHRFSVPLGRETMVIATVTDSNGKMGLTSRDRLVVWKNGNGGIGLYRQSSGFGP